MAKLGVESKFSLEMEKMTKETPAHYDEWNRRHKVLLNNDAYLHDKSNQMQQILENKADKTVVSSPYNFKGSVTHAQLPVEGNAVNDTYYCTDMKCKYTWNGSVWYQSSMNEVDYQEELGRLSSDMSALQDGVHHHLGSVNLFNIETFKNNTSLSNGDEVYTSGYGTSDYIPVINGKTIYFSVDGEPITIQYGTLYDAEKNYIKNISFVDNYTIPSNVKYIRITVSGFASEFEKLKIEYDKVTEYTPIVYVKDIINNLANVNADIEELRDDFYETAIKQIASGEDIHVTDSANSKVVEFHLYGKAKQNTTSGAQLANLPDTEEIENQGIKWSCKDGAVKAVGTAEGNAYSSHVGILCDIPIVAGTYSISGSNTSISAIVTVLTDNGGTNVYDNTSFILDGTERSVSLNIKVVNGMTVNETIYPMINKGAEPLPWELYTGGIPSPNSEYAQEIEVPTGNVVVRSCGNQLANLSDTVETSNAGITWSCENGAVTAIGTSNGISTTQTIGLYYDIPIVEGDYFISGSKNNIRALVGVKKADEHVSYYENTTFKLDGTEKHCRVFCQVEKGITVDATVYPMLNKGITALPFESYKETESIIPVTDFVGIPVSNGGNYTDENGQQWICDEVIKYADGTGEKMQKNKILKLTSALDWQLSSSLNTRYLLQMEMQENVRPICTHFIGDIIVNTNYGVVFNNYGLQLCFNTNFQTLAEWKEWLNQNDVYVCYALKESIRTPLTAEEIAEIEKLHTFNPITNISNDSDCGMSVTYIADTKRYIDNKIAELATAMVNNI